MNDKNTIRKTLIIIARFTDCVFIIQQRSREDFNLLILQRCVTSRKSEDHIQIYFAKFFFPLNLNVRIVLRGDTVASLGGRIVKIWGIGGVKH